MSVAQPGLPQMTYMNLEGMDAKAKKLIMGMLVKKTCQLKEIP